VSHELRIAVIGAGRIGRLHAENLRRRIRGATVFGIADIRRDVANEVASACGGVRSTAEPRELLADPRVDAVVIASSTDTHAGLIEEAAARGKHIFCEKPIDLDLDRARHVVATARERGVRLQIGFNRRFDTSFERLARELKRGTIGPLHLLRISSRDPAPPSPAYVKSSGGLFLDMTIHDFDMARFLSGLEVEEVFASASVLVDPAIGAAGDFDTATVQLRFQGGALGVIDNSRRAVYGYDQRAELFGPKGCLVGSNPTPGGFTLWDASGAHAGRTYDFFLDRYADSYVHELEAFVSAILERIDPPVGGEDGVRAIELARAAERSVRESRPVRVGEFVPARTP
jgi:myo-inositol 2-dehydrogenase/D-chiro-inositol 1-dehydrogenase